MSCTCDLIPCLCTARPSTVLTRQFRRQLEAEKPDSGTWTEDEYRAYTCGLPSAFQGKLLPDIPLTVNLPSADSWLTSWKRLYKHQVIELPTDEVDRIGLTPENLERLGIRVIPATIAVSYNIDYEDPTPVCKSTDDLIDDPPQPLVSIASQAVKDALGKNGEFLTVPLPVSKEQVRQALKDDTIELGEHPKGSYDWPLNEHVHTPPDPIARRWCPWSPELRHRCPRSLCRYEVVPQTTTVWPGILLCRQCGYGYNAEEWS